MVAVAVVVTADTLTVATKMGTIRIDKINPIIASAMSMTGVIIESPSA